MLRLYLMWQNLLRHCGGVLFFHDFIVWRCIAFMFLAKCYTYSMEGNVLADVALASCISWGKGCITHVSKVVHGLEEIGRFSAMVYILNIGDPHLK